MPPLAATNAAHDQYLDEKLRSILETLVESLLTHKPEDVSAFCIEWLIKYYKEHSNDELVLKELREEVEQLRTKVLAAGGMPPTGKMPLPPPAAAPAAASPRHEASRESILEAGKIAQIRDADRRRGVSAPAITQEKMKGWKKPFFEKGEGTRQKIHVIIKNNEKLQVLFGHLAEASVYDVIDAMSPVEVSAGKNLITQGEEGDNFYVVDAGTFDVYVQRGEAPAGKVLEYQPGAMFGELALMYNAPRAATVRATSDAKVWALDRESFQMMLTTAENLKNSQYEEFLTGCDLFKRMTKYEICQLSDLLSSELYDEDEAIMKQGDDGSYFYILEDGEAKAYITGEKGEVEVKHYTTPGEFFGEVALITKAPRRATVRGVNGGCTVLSVSREDFETVLGPIRDTLLKNLEEYPAYAEALRSAAANTPR